MVTDSRSDFIIAETSRTVSISRPERLSQLPILILHIHESCNCRCLMCDIWQRKNGRELDLAALARHRQSLLQLGVREVVLTGGEPLLHRSLDSLCAFLRDCGVRITLLTTGLLLSQRAAVIAKDVDEVIVSIDGPEHVHDEIRRVKGAYRLIREGIHEIQGRTRAVLIHGRSTIQKANHQLLRQTVAAAKDLSLQSISFLATDVTSQAFNRELIWPGERQSQIALESREIDALEAELGALLVDNADDVRSRYIVESPAKLRRIVSHFRAQLGQVPPTAPLCNAPWVSAVLEVDGTVRPCFFHRKIGNASELTLDQVLNGDDGRRFRRSLDVNRNEICQRCVCSLNYKTPVLSQA